MDWKTVEKLKDKLVKAALEHEPLDLEGVVAAISWATKEVAEACYSSVVDFEEALKKLHPEVDLEKVEDEALKEEE